jgi:hypothetical protein
MECVVFRRAEGGARGHRFLVPAPMLARFAFPLNSHRTHKTYQGNESTAASGLGSDVPPIADVPTALVGTVWSHCEPAVLRTRSSPAHPRS